MYTTWARAVPPWKLAAAPLNSVERFTVATPSPMVMSRRRVPAGMLVYMAGDASSSAPFGPASRAVIAALATAFVSGTVRSTGTSPGLSVKLPSMK